MSRKKIGEVASIYRGVSYKKNQASKIKQNNQIALIRANNISAGRFILNDLLFVPKDLVSEQQIVHRDDIVITMSSGSKSHVGKVAIAKDELQCAFGAFCAKISSFAINPMYLFYILSSNSFRNHIENQCKGTNINNIKQSYILDYEIEVPSINQQEKIVSQIEESLSQLDSAVETLKKTKQQLEVYRQSVLKEAFDISTVNHVALYELCSNIVDCPHSTPKWTKEGKLCLRTTNFKRGYLDLSEKNYVSNETFDLRNKRLIPLPGDIVYSREGAILGIACIIPDNTYVCLGQRMMLLRTSEYLNNRFLMHYLNSPKVNSYIKEMTGGSASPHVNVKDIKALQIPVLPIYQQKQIIKTIDSKLSVCDSIGQTVTQLLQQAEALRQSILKQAFEEE